MNSTGTVLTHYFWVQEKLWSQTFESILKSFGFAVSSYHGKNGVFKMQTFMDYCNRKQQQITCSGTGAHHQNGVAERSIQTVVGWARSLLLHAAIHWPNMANLKLWPFALNHAVYCWNILPDQHTKLITGSCTHNYTHLQRLNVCGCPTFVLDPRLQDEKKLPKRSPRSHLGCFLGYCTSYSSTVSLVLNLKTLSIKIILYMMIGLVQSPIHHPLLFLNPCEIILYHLIINGKFMKSLKLVILGRFCCRGDHQAFRINYFDTFAPVVFLDYS